MTAEKRYFIVTFTPLLIMMLGSKLWALALLPRVPDPMAVHFDGRLAADIFLAPTTTLLLFAVLNVIVLAVFAALTGLGLRHGTASRFAAGVTGFAIAALATIQVALFRTQTGLLQATDATLSWAGLGICLGMALVIGGFMAWVATPVPSAAQEPGAPAAVTVPEQGQAVWARASAMHPGLRIVVFSAAALTVVLAIALPSWVVALIAVLNLFAAFATLGWRLRVNAHGFSYRSFLGFPRGHLPHTSIGAAEVVEVHAGDWGGWGWRQNASGTGLITQSGPGLRLTRENGRILEISCNDAPTAVGLLNHYRSTRRYDEESGSF